MLCHVRSVAFIPRSQVRRDLLQVLDKCKCACIKELRVFVIKEMLVLFIFVFRTMMDSSGSSLQKFLVKLTRGYYGQ